MELVLLIELVNVLGEHAAQFLVLICRERE